MRTPRLITAAMTGAALTGLAACGGTTGSAGSGDPAAGPSSRTTGHAEPAPLRSHATTPPAADLTFHTALTTRAVSADGQVTSLDVAGTYRSGAHPAADLRPAGGDRAAPQELRFVGDTLYIRRGHMMRPGGGGKPWTRVTRTTSSVPMTRLYAAVERGRPAPLLHMIGTSRDTARTGAPKLGGVPTTRYSGTFDGATAAHRVAAADRRAVSELSAFRKLRFDLWLDASGRPRRLVLTGSEGERRYALTQTFDRYGTGVRVTAPPSRQVDDGDGPVLPHAPR